MHKFTLFTVILSIITVSVVIDMIVNGYSLSKDYVPPKEESAEVLDAADLAEKTVTSQSEKIVIPSAGKEPAKTVGTKSSEDPGNEEGDISLYGFEDKETITAQLLSSVGIKDGKIKAVTAEKPFLQVISLTENAKSRLKTVNLFDFEEYLGTIYALRFPSMADAEQFYSDIKAESLLVAGATIRETNTFGDASFYLNQEGKTKTAFSTVRIGADVYGFEYPHGSHQIFKDLAAGLKGE